MTRVPLSAQISAVRVAERAAGESKPLPMRPAERELQQDRLQAACATLELVEKHHAAVRDLITRLEQEPRDGA